MASDAPLPTELHKVTIVMDGAKLKGANHEARRKAYRAYMKKLRSLVEAGRLGGLVAPRGVKVEKPRLQLKQSTISARKRRKDLDGPKTARASRRPRRRGRR